MALIQKLNSVHLNEILFFEYEILRSYFHKRKFKILFSIKEEWKPAIIRGFASTKHEIMFDELTTENIVLYDLVVPLTINDIIFLDETRHLIEKNLIPIPRRESVLLCDDKYRFNRTLIENGFGEFIPKIDCKQIYPYILKKRIDDWGENSHIISNAQEEQKYSHLINNQNYFCQEVIPGSEEYATHILFKDRKILCVINNKYGFKSELPIKGKDKEESRKICSCPYLESFTTILNFLEFEGLCCINYKIHQGIPYIFEINPRFGGTLAKYFFSFLRHL
ncbi:MAG: ATP-grasp domain-containing protein [Methylococcaceae bacterium]